MVKVLYIQNVYLEGLPDYWGIETSTLVDCYRCHIAISGRITRLLGY